MSDQAQTFDKQLESYFTHVKSPFTLVPMAAAVSASFSEVMRNVSVYMICVLGATSVVLHLWFWVWGKAPSRLSPDHLQPRYTSRERLGLTLLDIVFLCAAVAVGAIYWRFFDNPPKVEITTAAGQVVEVPQEWEEAYEGLTNLGVIERRYAFRRIFNKRELPVTAQFASRLNRNVTDDLPPKDKQTIRMNKWQWHLARGMDSYFLQWVKSYCPDLEMDVPSANVLIVRTATPFDNYYQTFSNTITLRSGIKLENGYGFLVAYEDGNTYKPMYRQIPLTIDPSTGNINLVLSNPDKGEELVTILSVTSNSGPLPETGDAFDVRIVPTSN